MNIKKVTAALKDPAVVSQLRLCTNVGQITIALNMAGVACSYDEAKMLLRAVVRYVDLVEESGPAGVGFSEFLQLQLEKARA